MEKIDSNLIFNIDTNHEFEDLSFKIFNYQINNNEIYRKYASLILKDKIPKKIRKCRPSFFWDVSRWPST